MSSKDLNQELSVLNSAESLDARTPHVREQHAEVSLQVRYAHHKSRHEHYKKAYRHVRKYRWLSMSLLVITFASVFYLAALLITYHDLSNNYEGLLVDVRHAEQENTQLKQALLSERKYNFELNQENQPELRIFAFDSLIATDQQQVRSAFFTASESSRKQLNVHYQLLVEGPINSAFDLVLVDQVGQQIHRQSLDLKGNNLKKGESKTFEGDMSFGKDLDVRYFKIASHQGAQARD